MLNQENAPELKCLSEMVFCVSHPQAYKHGCIMIHHNPAYFVKIFYIIPVLSHKSVLVKWKFCVFEDPVS